jgi:uncharacterized protein (TIGR02118 family)
MVFAEEVESLPAPEQLPGLERGLVHTAAQAHDPFLYDGGSPPLALQLYFGKIGALEAAVAGPLRALPPSRYEAMRARSFSVGDATIRSERWCTYLVAYDGPAEDPDAWHAHYFSHHPSLMAQLPGIRELEIYTPLDWIGVLPGERMRSLQRNKVAFDSPAALTEALDSPLREEMRADFKTFPAFSGQVTHFPMWTRRIPGIADLS